MAKVLNLSDSNFDWPRCRCKEERPRAHFVLALCASLRRSDDTCDSMFPRRLHEFFALEVLSHPRVLLVDLAQMACAMYMCV